MSVDTKALFNGSFTKSWTAAEADSITLDIFRGDNPPTSADYASFFLHAIKTTGATQTITVTAQFRIGDNGNSLDKYGVEHNVLDDTNSNSFTVATTPGTAWEANLYAQSWWKANSGLRIKLTRSANEPVTLTATGVIR